MKEFIAFAVESYLEDKLTRDELEKALEQADPDKKPWYRQRVQYQIRSVKEKRVSMTGTKRTGDGSPSTSNLTTGTGESFELGEDDEIDMDLTAAESVSEAEWVAAASQPKPTGGRPTGSNYEASRKIKQAKKDALNSATKAYAAERQAGQDHADAEASRRRKSVTSRNASGPAEERESTKLSSIVEAKQLKYTELLSAEGIEHDISINATTVKTRVFRHNKDPERHSLEVQRRGPVPVLADVEPALVTMLEELAEYGVYLNRSEIRCKMADMIDGTDLAEKYCLKAASSRGEKDEVGGLVLKDTDLDPGNTWAGGFLSRWATRLAQTLPTALDTTREKWQTEENFAWWYLCLERFFTKYGFATIEPEFVGETVADTLTRVYGPERPRLRFDPMTLERVIMWDEVNLNIDMSDEKDHHKANLVIAPAGARAQLTAPQSSQRGTLIAALDGNGDPLPPVLIIKSEATNSIFARDGVKTGINYFSTNKTERFPGLPTVNRNGVECPGRVYVSKSGGVTPAILVDIVKNVWAPCFPGRSPECVIASLCDANTPRTGTRQTGVHAYVGSCRGNVDEYYVDHPEFQPESPVTYPPHNAQLPGAENTRPPGSQDTAGTWHPVK